MEPLLPPQPVRPNVLKSVSTFYANIAALKVRLQFRTEEQHMARYHIVCPTIKLSGGSFNGHILNQLTQRNVCCIFDNVAKNNARIS